MTAHDTLLIVFGMTAGFALGYVTAWRFARKLEAHDVVLAEWDVPYDAQAQQQRPRKVG